METLLLQSKSKKDMVMFAELAKKVGLAAKFIDNEYIEDISLANAMKTGRTGEHVDTKAYLAKLKKA